MKLSNLSAAGKLVSPGSLSFRQQELQWCFVRKFLMASSPRLAGPNIMSYDLQQRQRDKSAPELSTWLELKEKMATWCCEKAHPFSPLLMTDGSVRISPTPANESGVIRHKKRLIFKRNKCGIGAHTRVLPCRSSTSSSPRVYSYVQWLKASMVSSRRLVGTISSPLLLLNFLNSPVMHSSMANHWPAEWQYSRNTSRNLNTQNDERSSRPLISFKGQERHHHQNGKRAITTGLSDVLIMTTDVVNNFFLF